MKTPSLLAPEYLALLNDLKARIRSARISAAHTVNREVILLYWDIGRAIVEKQQRLAWGESVINRLSQDLAGALPGVTGFSPRNLRYMKQFYTAYSSAVIWQQPVAKLDDNNPIGVKTNSHA